MTLRLAPLALIASLLAVPLALVAPSPVLADGFIYVPDGVVVLPRPVPPRPRPPRRPPRPHFPLQVTRHRVSVEIDDTLPIPGNVESHEVIWVSLADAPRYNNNRSTWRMVEKTRRLRKELLRERSDRGMIA